MIRVNLVPQAILDKEAQKQQAVLFGVGAGFMALLLAGISFSHYYSAATLEKTLVQHEGRLKKLEKIVKQVEALEAKARAVRARLNVMEGLLKARELYPKFMTELLKTFPSGIWLTGMTTSPSDKGLTVSMESTARLPEDVSDWLRRLSRSELWTGESIGPLKLSDDGNTFSMSVVFTPAAKK